MTLEEKKISELFNEFYLITGNYPAAHKSVKIVVKEMIKENDDAFLPRATEPSVYAEERREFWANIKDKL